MLPCYIAPISEIRERFKTKKKINDGNDDFSLASALSFLILWLSRNIFS